jgi:hypothetical protein
MWMDGFVEAVRILAGSFFGTPRPGKSQFTAEIWGKPFY